MYLVYRILIIILIISFITGILNIIYEHKHRLKKESNNLDDVEQLSLEDNSINEVVVDDEEVI
ncbi:MAG: hypothetical protein IJI22_05980 [Bacilli bacterium]|nr:hypothetical protein [Bacilli bacterium]